ARFQHLIEHLNSPMDKVDPRPSPGGKLMNQMVARIQDRRIDPRILPQPQGRIPTVAGEQEPEHPASLRQREALLLSRSLKSVSIRRHEALEDPGGLDPGA